MTQPPSAAALEFVQEWTRCVKDCPYMAEDCLCTLEAKMLDAFAAQAVEPWRAKLAEQCGKTLEPEEPKGPAMAQPPSAAALEAARAALDVFAALAVAAEPAFVAGIRKAADLLEENERSADPRFGPACLDPIKGLCIYADKVVAAEHNAVLELQELVNDLEEKLAEANIAAERAKPTASDLEIARSLASDWTGNYSNEFFNRIAAALAERGEREREALARIIYCWEQMVDSLGPPQRAWSREFDKALEQGRAAIRNQTLTD